ncbi:MAG: alpha/beta hydrolase, partial [Robiginitalea sp.]
FIFACILMLPVFSQSERKVESITLNSEILNEARELKIYLPADYNPEEAYPVIYITDGSGSNFNVARNYMDALSDPAYRIIPSSILVGIVHRDRNKELNVFKEESGKRFMKYLFEEAVPYIDANYSTSGFNAMIGHSNGAEYNHFLMLADGNPFRGFISMSTAFNTDMRAEIAKFFEQYQGEQLYYFVANGALDGPFRVQSGNDFEGLYTKSANKRITFAGQTFEGSHNSMVPNSLLDGLKFIFQDYNNMENYATFMEYRDNYKADMKQRYGISSSYQFADIEGFWSDILINKKIEEYEQLVDFINAHQLWPIIGIIDPVNQGNQYFFMGAYPETIASYNKALNNMGSFEERVYSMSMGRTVLPAYKMEDRMDEVMPFLIRSREALGEEEQLLINYYIASFSLENQIALEEGTRALEYCKANYTENRLFSKEDLDALEEGRMMRGR